jgi:hypothetical protein
MEKRLILLYFLIISLSGVESLKSQDPGIRKEINYIDSLLKTNPYLDTFLEITYRYSIDISPEKELVVNMDFNGPFTTTFKARLTDLNNAFVIDTSSDWSSSVCWQCKTSPAGKEERCIYQENLYPGGKKDIVDSDDICIKLTTQSNIRLRLIKSLEELIKKVLE